MVMIRIDTEGLEQIRAMVSSANVKTDELFNRTKEVRDEMMCDAEFMSLPQSGAIIDYIENSISYLENVSVKLTSMRDVLTIAPEMFEEHEKQVTESLEDIVSRLDVIATQMTMIMNEPDEEDGK